jgi:hypothetical protein
MASSKNRQTSAWIESVLGRPVVLSWRGKRRRHPGLQRQGKRLEQEVFREQRLKRAGAHGLLVPREPLVSHAREAFAAPTGRPSDGIRRASWLPAVSLARSACSATTCSMTRRMRAGSSIPTIFSAPSTDCTLAISASSSSAVWGSGSAAGTPRCAATRHRREQNCLVHRNAADRLPHWRHAKGRPRRPPRRSSTGRPARLALDRSAASRLASARHSSEQSLARRMKRRPGQAAARLPWSARYRRLEIELDPFRGTTGRRCNLAYPCPSRIKPLLAGKIHFDPRETHG